MTVVTTPSCAVWCDPYSPCVVAVAPTARMPVLSPVSLQEVSGLYRCVVSRTHIPRYSPWNRERERRSLPLLGDTGRKRMLLFSRSCENAFAYIVKLRECYDRWLSASESATRSRPKRLDGNTTCRSRRIRERIPELRKRDENTAFLYPNSTKATDQRPRFACLDSRFPFQRSRLRTQGPG